MRFWHTCLHTCFLALVAHMLPHAEQWCQQSQKIWSHRDRFVQYSTSEQRAHGWVMRFCSWGLSFWFSSWAWEAFAGMSLQRTRVHASCSRFSRREPGPRAQGRGPVAQGPRPVVRAITWGTTFRSGSVTDSRCCLSLCERITAQGLELSPKCRLAAESSPRS